MTLLEEIKTKCPAELLASQDADAITNGSSEVILVTDELSDRVVISGDTLNFPTVSYICGQPA